MLQYHLVNREAKVGKNKGKKIYYAQAVTRGVVSFDSFCREVADGSTVDVADVKAVLSRLHTVITRNVERGFSVEVGELGNFRPSFGSVEVTDPATFTVAEHIRRPKIIFQPRPAFVNGLRTTAQFERVEVAASRGRSARPKGATPSAPASPGTGNPSGDGHLGI